MGPAAVTVRPVTGPRRRSTPQSRMGSSRMMTSEDPHVAAKRHDALGRCGTTGLSLWATVSPATPLTCGFVVVGTGVDPVTSRFSGARSTN